MTRKRFGEDNKRIMYVTPHLSTGGMPQYLLKKIQLMNEDFEVYCVEYDCIATWYVVQREQVASILGDRFITLQDCPKEKLLELIATIKPGIIHFEEFPETFLLPSITEKIYKRNRDYLIFESCHGVYFDPKDKRVFPDKFLFVSEFQANLYKKEGVPFDVVEYPVEQLVAEKMRCQQELGFEQDCKHVINVGLFTAGKNQGELMSYAKAMLNEKVRFHFVGNQAPNFEDYWGPLMKDLPCNCTVWGERKDVDKFYQAADLMVFTSKMETAPIVIKEALSWGLSSLIYNLPAYKNTYKKYDKVKYLTPYNFDANLKLIRNTLA
jgi:glycosyltransferase involved in cell wall biosynthesis